MPTNAQQAAQHAEGYAYTRGHVLAHTRSLTALALIVEGIRDRNPSPRDYWFTTGALVAINERIESTGQGKARP